MSFGDLSNEKVDVGDVTCVCIGSGRFLRAVFVPIMVELGEVVAIVQPRKNSFGEYMTTRGTGDYEVDTVAVDGTVTTTKYPIRAWGRLDPDQKRHVMNVPQRTKNLRYIGMGVTEEGIAPNSAPINHLAELLWACCCANLPSHISVLNTDNIPNNGSQISMYVNGCDFVHNLNEEKSQFTTWLSKNVTFHNTMVDRVTSFRSGEASVPSTEPLPAKAFVIEDLEQLLPQKLKSIPGVVVRTEKGQLEIDHSIKLRVINAIHTALVYMMGLSGLFVTNDITKNEIFRDYLDQLFENDIVSLCTEFEISRSAVYPVFAEWTGRLTHPHFGLSCFWVAQNASKKLGIRLLPTVRALISQNKRVSDFMVFAIAVMLRFLTPLGQQPRMANTPPIFCGLRDPAPKDDANADISKTDSTASSEYAAGLSASRTSQIYEFADGHGAVPLMLRQLGTMSSASTASATPIVVDVLGLVGGLGVGSQQQLWDFSQRIAVMLVEMLNGKPALTLLRELNPSTQIVLPPDEIAEAVKQELEVAEAIDLHTHLFAPELGLPIQWGIDDMLTHPYLISEFLVRTTMPAVDFHALSKVDQAAAVWELLFLKHAPVSEGCRGVITALHMLGLSDLLSQRSLSAIRNWFAQQNLQSFSDRVFRLAKLKYVVMSNNPFHEEERLLWSDVRASNSPYFRPALCLDTLSDGNWSQVPPTLKQAGFTVDWDGLFKFLDSHTTVAKPEHITMSMPHDWQISSSGASSPIDNKDQRPSLNEILDKVVMPLCAKHGLPLMLRLGTRRYVNQTLGLAGDSMGVASLDSLQQLCLRHPKQKFLVMFLSRLNHHEVTVLGTKFPNLHVVGCWWYCNTPSSVREISELRLELLGTSFTAIASSSRVLDQLVYKWAHSRDSLAEVLCQRYRSLGRSGWPLSRQNIRNDVNSLCGGAYLDFMHKQL